jgi:Tol biopolymer transport system component
VGGEIRGLEPKSFRLLVLLVENPNRVLAKDEIMKAVWPDAFVSDNSLTRAIAQLRKALDDDPKLPKYIETVPSIGYRFVGALQAATADPPPPPAHRKFPTTLILGASLALVAGVAIWWLTGRAAPANYPLRVTKVSKLTSYPGDEREPSISPDGSYVAFSWSGPAGDNYDIYVVQEGGQAPLRLTQDPATDSFPAWSPDGRQIAFIRKNVDIAEIILVPPLGGPERVLHRFARFGADLDFTQNPILSWSKDGKWIIFSGQLNQGGKYQLFALSVEDGAARPISTPGKDVIGDSSPALSADTSSLAFIRYLSPRNGAVMIQAMGPSLAPQGDPMEVPSSGHGVHSPSWLEDGSRLLFADARQILEWDRKSGTTQVYAADRALGGMSLGPKRGDTRRLVASGSRDDTDIWSLPLDPAGMKATKSPQPFLRSTEWDSHPDFSPDGRRVVFISKRSGSPEVWICDAEDGGNLRQLSRLSATVLSYPKWSPDGTRIVFHARKPDIAQVYVVDINQGVPRKVTEANPGLAVATWSNDGKFLYASTLLGGTTTTYRFPTEGGPYGNAKLERLFQGDLARESVDGQYVLYRKTSAPGIFRRSLQGDVAKNQEELLIADFWPNGQLGGYAPVATGVYYVSGDAHRKPGPFRYFDYRSGKSIDIAPAVPGLELGFTISPDRRRILFPAIAEVGGDLLLFELR